MTNEITDYWNNFKSKNPQVKDADFGEAYAFADPEKPDEQTELARLVATGIKTATTSAFDLYEEGEPVPQVGNYDIILDGKNKPVCITQTTKVYVVPFSEISAEHAFLEGEGDRTLAYWKKVHTDFFKAEYAEVGRTFSSDANCLCENFKVVYC